MLYLEKWRNWWWNSWRGPTLEKWRVLTTVIKLHNKPSPTQPCGRKRRIFCQQVSLPLISSSASALSLSHTHTHTQTHTPRPTLHEPYTCETLTTEQTYGRATFESPRDDMYMISEVLHIQGLLFWQCILPLATSAMKKKRSLKAWNGKWLIPWQLASISVLLFKSQWGVVSSYFRKDDYHYWWLMIYRNSEYTILWKGNLP